MFVDFKEISKTSRVWIYQSDKYFSDIEVNKIGEKIKDFIQNWNNHGEGLKGSYQIKYNQFIILVVDEDHKLASGCSIDSSVQLIKKIENEFYCDLFDKLKIAFKIEENINIVSMLDFQKYAKGNKITKETIVFNNLVKTVNEYESGWEVAVSDSWHARFF